MYIPPSVALEMARARQEELLSEARHHRLVMEVRGARRASLPRRAVARYLLLVARRVDPSLRASASRAVVECP
jgi:hypothetical protein